MMARRLLLDGFDLEDSKDSKSASIQARILLSGLAAQQGLHCPPALWSPRGQGVPCHPNLPVEWHASLSHKRGRVIVGLSRTRFGLDLEYANTRHGSKLEALVGMLPESEIRTHIQQSDCPLSSFYQVWTLYESLFKLSGHTATPAESLLAVRLKPMEELNLNYRVWQDTAWTLGLVSEEDLQPCPSPGALFPGLKPVDIRI